MPYPHLTSILQAAADIPFGRAITSCGAARIVCANESHSCVMQTTAVTVAMAAVAVDMQHLVIDGLPFGVLVSAAWRCLAQILTFRLGLWKANSLLSLA